MVLTRVLGQLKQQWRWGGQNLERKSILKPAFQESALQQELLKTIFSICAPPANTGASRMCRRAMPICASWGHRVIATEPFVKHFCLLFLLSELPLQQLQPLFLELGCRADSKADDRAARVSKGRVQATLTLVDARVQARTTAV